MGGVSVQLIPFLQSFVLRTACGLRGAGGVSEGCSSRCPCEAFPVLLCPAGRRSHSPGDLQHSPLVSPASLAGSGCQNVPLVSGDRFCSPHSIFLSACSLLRLGDFPSDPRSMAELRRMGACCAGPPCCILQLSPAALRSRCVPVGQCGGSQC